MGTAAGVVHRAAGHPALKVRACETCSAPNCGKVCTMADRWQGNVSADWSREVFTIDLNTVRDGNRVVSLVGFRGPQRVPKAGETATVVDEDGNAYDATVETVLPDTRVYLRVKWASSRTTAPPLVVDHGRPSFTVPGGQAAAQ